MTNFGFNFKTYSRSNNKCPNVEWPSIPALFSQTPGTVSFNFWYNRNGQVELSDKNVQAVVLPPMARMLVIFDKESGGSGPRNPNEFLEKCISLSNLWIHRFVKTLYWFAGKINLPFLRENGSGLYIRKKISQSNSPKKIPKQIAFNFLQMLLPGAFISCVFSPFYDLVNKNKDLQGLLVVHGLRWSESHWRTR